MIHHAQCIHTKCMYLCKVSTTTVHSWAECVKQGHFSHHVFPVHTVCRYLWNSNLFKEKKICILYIYITFALKIFDAAIDDEQTYEMEFHSPFNNDALVSSCHILINFLPFLTWAYQNCQTAKVLFMQSKIFSIIGSATSISEFCALSNYATGST